MNFLRAKKNFVVCSFFSTMVLSGEILAQEPVSIQGGAENPVQELSLPREPIETKPSIEVPSAIIPTQEHISLPTLAIPEPPVPTAPMPAPNEMSLNDAEESTQIIAEELEPNDKIHINEILASTNTYETGVHKFNLELLQNTLPFGIETKTHLVLSSQGWIFGKDDLIEARIGNEIEKKCDKILMNENMVEIICPLKAVYPSSPLPIIVSVKRSGLLLGAVSTASLVDLDSLVNRCRNIQNDGAKNEFILAPQNINLVADQENSEFNMSETFDLKNINDPINKNQYVKHVKSKPVQNDVFWQTLQHTLNIKVDDKRSFVFKCPLQYISVQPDPDQPVVQIKLDATDTKPSSNSEEDLSQQTQNLILTAQFPSNVKVSPENLKLSVWASKTWFKSPVFNISDKPIEIIKDDNALIVKWHVQIQQSQSLERKSISRNMLDGKFSVALFTRSEEGEVWNYPLLPMSSDLSKSKVLPVDRMDFIVEHMPQDDTKKIPKLLLTYVDSILQTNKNSCPAVAYNDKNNEVTFSTKTNFKTTKQAIRFFYVPKPGINAAEREIDLEPGNKLEIDFGDIKGALLPVVFSADEKIPYYKCAAVWSKNKKY